jgi:predicted DNA-binding protein with PD1-like motif
MVKRISVEAGKELMKTLEEECARQEIRNGAIVSVIGAVDGCCISNMPMSDAHQDILTEYDEPFELTGVGEIRDGKPHIHCVLGREGDQALSGHLHWAYVRTWFVAVYVLPMD